MTNKIVLRTVDEFMSGYTPIYRPFYPLLLGKSQSYSDTVGSQTWRRLEAVGDLRAKHITPKDTEIRQVSVRDSSKVFKKYFLANQYVQSDLQETEDIEGVSSQVLDEHQKQFDEMVLLGDGTAANNVINNGLYWSGDSNYTLNSSEEIRNAPDTQTDYYDLMMSTVEDSLDLAGTKVIVVYGDTALSKLTSLIPEQAVTLKQLITDNVGDNGRIIRLPKDITPAGANGWMILNTEFLKLHYTVLPAMKDQGVNAEKMYSWHNFLMGSAMVDVLASGAIIRQPVTFEA